MIRQTFHQMDQRGKFNNWFSGSPAVLPSPTFHYEICPRHLSSTPLLRRSGISTGVFFICISPVFAKRRLQPHKRGLSSFSRRKSRPTSGRSSSFEGNPTLIPCYLQWAARRFDGPPLRPQPCPNLSVRSAFHQTITPLSTPTNHEWMKKRNTKGQR